MPDNIKGALDTLTSVNRIGFTQFTSGLINGVFTTIVNSAINQMSAYANLVSSVSKSLADFTADVLGPNQENVIFVIKNDFGLTISSGNAPSVTLNEDQFNNVTSALKDVVVANKSITEATNLPALSGTPKTSTITLAKLQPFVAAKISAEAESKYNLLRTLLQLGMQKVVVDKGHIRTKLTFSIDAANSESKKTKELDRNSSSSGIAGGIIGGAGGQGGVLGGIGGFDSDKSLSVSVVNERSSSATNLSADIIGEVLIEFRTDSFPIANF